MKKLIIATGALLIGTSALAWQPSTKAVAQVDKAPIAQSGTKAPAVALVAKSNDLPVAEAETASASWLAEADMPKPELASAEVSSAAEMPKPELVSAEAFGGDSLAGKDDPKAFDPAQGDPNLDLAVTPEPLETAAAPSGPQPAAGNYPACSPGPGDDNCIQLYEPGVQTALASWSQPTGGLAGAETQMASAEDTTLAGELGEPATGVGGPYEPVDASADAAMNGDGALDAAAGETGEGEQLAAYTPPAEYTGVGGPIAETGYPACSATVTDRCIQLYERGVTGEGN